MIEILNGSRDYIKSEDFLDNLVTDSGYNKESKQVKDLANGLEELTPFQQKSFLLFVIGSPNLQFGGFAALGTPFTVGMGSADENALLSAATCFSRLKLSPYKDKEIMREKLIKAIEYCQNSFYLS